MIKVGKYAVFNFEGLFTGTKYDLKILYVDYNKIPSNKEYDKNGNKNPNYWNNIIGPINYKLSDGKTVEHWGISEGGLCNILGVTHDELYDYICESYGLPDFLLNESLIYKPQNLIFAGMNKISYYAGPVLAQPHETELGDEEKWYSQLSEEAIEKVRMDVVESWGSGYSGDVAAIRQYHTTDIRFKEVKTGEGRRWALVTDERKKGDSRTDNLEWINFELTIRPSKNKYEASLANGNYQIFVPFVTHKPDSDKPQMGTLRISKAIDGFYMNALFQEQIAKSVLEEYTLMDINYEDKPVDPEEPGGKDFNIMERFSPVKSTNGIGLYKLKKEEVQSLFENIYSETFTESVYKFLKIYDNNVGEFLIGLYWWYGLNEVIKPTEPSTVVKLGSTELTDQSGKKTTGQPIKHDYYEFSSKVFTIRGHHQNFLDYEPYSQYQINIPFYGLYDIKGTDIVDKNIQLKYRVNVTNGTAVCYINVVTSKGAYLYTLSTVNMTMGINIPLNASSKGNGLNIIGSVISKIPTTATMAVGSIASQMESSTAIGGQLDNNTVQLGDLRVTTLAKIAKIDNYDNVANKGYITYKKLKIGDCKNYIEIGNIISGLNCPFKEEIEELLKDGVYV